MQNEGIPTTTRLENENEANVEGFTIEYKMNKIENSGIPVENKENMSFLKHGKVGKLKTKEMMKMQRMRIAAKKSKAEK